MGDHWVTNGHPIGVASWFLNADHNSLDWELAPAPSCANHNLSCGNLELGPKVKVTLSRQPDLGHYGAMGWLSDP